MQRTLLFLVISFSLGCNKTQPVSHKNITNSWKLVQVLESNKDITFERNPNNNRRMELLMDGTYHTEGKPEPPDRGTWTLDTTKKDILFLDSDAGPGSDSKWNLWFQEDTLYCRGNEMLYQNIITKWVVEKP